MMDSSEYRQLYADSINRYIDNLRIESVNKRKEFISPEKLSENPEKYRKLYYEMLGYPLCKYIENLPVPAVRKEFVAEDDMGKIYRIMLEVIDGFTFEGLLFFPKNFCESNKYSFVISQHGGSGTPELCSDFYNGTNYTNMTRRVLERGAVVFAPQLYLWNIDMFGVPYDRLLADRRLKQLGGSITALEIYCIMRCIDYFTTLPYIDSDKIGMIGLSYGGFYTMFTAAADKRIKSVYSSCFFNDRFEYDWPDWVWDNAANTFLDAEIAALVAPRRLYIESGISDQLFNYKKSEIEYNRLIPYYEKQNAQDNLKFSLFEGDHMLDINNEGIDYFFEALK